MVGSEFTILLPQQPSSGIHGLCLPNLRLKACATTEPEYGFYSIPLNKNRLKEKLYTYPQYFITRKGVQCAGSRISDMVYSNVLHASVPF